MTPAAVTAVGCVCGVIAGHLYYYRDLNLNIFGMLLHIAANAFDNADGQLARLINRRSRMGRVIDSLADHLIWLSIYFHLALRYVVEGSSPIVGLLALAAGLSHACQGAAADYYRNGYLYFVRGRSRADLDSSVDLRMEFRQLRWRDEPWHKFLLALYLNFTSQQELLAPGLELLHKAIERAFPEEIPLWLQKRYRQLAQPMLRWWRLLMTNTRMLFLFLLLFIGRPIWYFWFELTLFNFLLVYLLLYQERASQSLVRLVTTHREAA
jgi:phosphatidylglycerophosphate synthase